jgi:uncharacterized protein (TIGR03086 family)
MTTEGLASAFALTRNVLANVRPDQLDDPTPCVSWDVRRLVNHIVGGSHWFAITTNAGAAPEVDTTEDTDYTQGDVLASYDEGIAASLAAFESPGAQEKMVRLPFGEIPGAMFMGVATVDQFTHGWDLAKATGQDTDLAPEMAEQLLAQCRVVITDQFRGEDGQALFGAEVEAPDGASAADRLAAFLGRSV